MGTNSIGAVDIEVDTEFFTVGSTKAVVGDLFQGWLAVGKFGWEVSIIVMPANGVAQVTAEDATEWVTQSAALLKGLIIVTGGLPTMEGVAKKPSLRGKVSLGGVGMEGLCRSIRSLSSYVDFTALYFMA